ncbi:MAG: leucine-rich repeat protein [Bacteroidaceae bacterium]|nr:leucine-rich repeat protein [Bacteroidaceae bacterium]
MKKILFIILMALLPVVAFSDDEYSIHGCDAIIDGICYKFPSSSGDEAWVSYEWYHHATLPTNTTRVEWIETEPNYSGDIVIPETISYNGKTYWVTGINEYAFYKCGNLTSVTFPSSLRSIGKYAFYKCGNLTSVTLPGSLGIIGSYAFSDCTGLVSVSIPKGMKEIYDHIFYKCTGLKSITIPEGVTYIGLEAFAYCSGLTDVYCLAESAPNATTAFDYVDLSNIMLHVPLGYEELYRNNLPWKSFGVVSSGIEINATHFPDSYFRQWLLKQAIGSDGVLTDDEVANVKELSLYHNYDYPPNDTGCGPISSLKGIEFFTELTKLSCGGLSLTVLDLTKNTNLTVLRCGEQYLTELDLTKNTKLKELWFEANHRDVTVDISNCSALKVADFTDSKLIGLNVSGCSALETLQCERGKLTALDVSGCSALKELNCESNKLTTLNVSECTALVRLTCYDNKLKGEGWDAMVQSLPNTSSGKMYPVYNKAYPGQNDMTTRQVAVAKSKGWAVICYENNMPVEYEGIELITFTQNQMATISLPTDPDVSKGKYYRLDRVEEGQIVFEQELLPRARVPYIIVPSEDFSIEMDAKDLKGLQSDTVAVKGVSFIGSYVRKEFEHEDGYYIEIIDKTPDCLDEWFQSGKAIVGALRAYLTWDDPIDHGGAKGPEERKGIVLLDVGDCIDSPTADVTKDDAIYDLSGREMVNGKSSNGKMPRGIYLKNGKKVLMK